MKYISTRGGSAAVGFAEAVLNGQAPDGGLYLPQFLPDVSHMLADWSKLSYVDLATEIMRRFVGEDLDKEEQAVGQSLVVVSVGVWSVKK